MKFSICIPNYNYGKYLERTIRSVLEQTYDDFEIHVSDNASTDDSVEVVRAISDPRIHLSVNRTNVGFAGNLDRAVRNASGDFVILLSSDDVMRPHALETYARCISELGTEAQRTVFCASCDMIDEQDRVTNHLEFPHHDAWQAADLDKELTAALKMPICRVEAGRLLNRCLLSMCNPFIFCATAFPRALYGAVEGYGGNRLFGPDKWFHWRLLGVATSAILVRERLFGYRWHSQNQSALQVQTGALKYLMDEYQNSFEVSDDLLQKAGITRARLERSFVEYSVVRHGLALLSNGQRSFSRRTFAFGRASYPWHLRRNWHAWVFRAFLALGPVGEWAAKRLRMRYAAPSFTTRP